MCICWNRRIGGGKTKIAGQRFAAWVAGVLVGISAAGMAAGQSEGWKPLDIRKVKVGGEIGRRIDVTITNNVLAVNADRDFLQPFQERNRPDGYIGLGKFVDSIVRLAAYSQKPEMVALKKHVVEEAIKTQEADGYIGTLKPESRMWQLWDIHEMGYLVLGLTNDYRYFQEGASLQAAEKLAQYILGHWPEQTPEAVGGLTVHMAAIGLEEALIALFGQTANSQYIDFCSKQMQLPQWDTGIVEGRWGLLEGHAYQYLCRCLAQLQLYDIQPDPRLRVNSQKTLDYLAGGDGLLIPGLCSYQEAWHSNQQGFWKLGETCSTAYLIRWLGELLQLEGQSFYGDIIERSIYNGLFAAQSPDGRRLRYYSPLEGPRIYFDLDTYCCPGNYRRIVSELPEMIYYRTEEGVAVNLYAESSAELEIRPGIPLTIRQETEYPNSGEVEICLEPAQATEFSMKLRIPRWCRQAEISINGRDSIRDVAGGSFVTLHRQWQSGDRVRLAMPMEWRLVKGRKSQAGRVAVMRGPQLFCLNPERQENFSPDFMRRMAIDPASLQLGEPDSSIRPQGLTCRAKFWNPNNYWPSAPADMPLTLTEYADPGCQQTYFLLINPQVDMLVEDELCELMP